MKDRFSDHANQYAQFRPMYPPELYDFIYSHVRHFDAAWDAGTGNGQVARELSKKFKKVYGTDISARQIENAYRAENIEYSISSERSAFPDQSVELITVAQAAHWFDMTLFSQEAMRVLKPGGMIAIWGYGLLTVNDEVDPLITHFYKSIVGPYWDQERKHIEEHYAHLYFPFEQIPTPSFTIRVSWDWLDLKGYINTWSSVQKYIAEHKHNPVDDLMANISPYWMKDPPAIHFPVFLKVGFTELGVIR